MDDKKQPIIVKKIKKGGHGHHGGAWKVAYADFVTAMMAFFLLMWLMGGTSVHVREGIADWFRNPTGVQGPGGASTSLIKMGGAMEVPRSNKQKKAPSESNKKSFQIKDKQGNKDNEDKTNPERNPEKKDQVSEAEKQQDKDRLDSLLQDLMKAIGQSQALKPFKDQLLLDITPEGLRIQIIDKENRAMFDSSSAILKSYTKQILRTIARIINQVPNRISITGHTDATRFATAYVFVEYGSFEERRAYSNWELSADRANAARRELILGGMQANKIGRVVGLASSILFDKKNPQSPVNRRISIIVLNREAEVAMGIVEGRGGVKAEEIPKKLKPK